MNIVGEKILLRAIEFKDTDMLLEIINDPQTEHSLGGWSFPVSELTQKKWIENLNSNKETLRCVIEERYEGKAIGTVILSKIDYKNAHAEIHIKLTSKAQGKGFGTDTINTMVKYAFEELRLNCVYAQINSFNQPSKKLFEKCNFIEEGVLKKRIYKKGTFSDVHILSIIKNG